MKKSEFFFVGVGVVVCSILGITLMNFLWLVVFEARFARVKEPVIVSDLHICNTLAAKAFVSRGDGRELIDLMKLSAKERVAIK